MATREERRTAKLRAKKEKTLQNALSSGGKSQGISMTPWQETWYRLCKNKSALVGLAIIVILVLVIVFAEVISPYERGIDQNIRSRLQGPSAEHWLGTDGYGRDVFTRIIHGAKNTLAISFISATVTLIIGTPLGCYAAYYGGRFDAILMRVCDMFNAIPSLIMALAVVAALGANLTNLIVAIAISGIPNIVRGARSRVLGSMNNEYIMAARSYGSTDSQIVFGHILPNALGPTIVSFTGQLADLTLRASSLSFIGLGIQPPAPEWGAMLSEAREFMRTEPALVIYPGVAILLVALAFNLVGDGLRDALDPKLRD